MLSLGSDPELSPQVTPYIFFFKYPVPPGDRTWAFPDFKFREDVIPYLNEFSLDLWLLRRCFMSTDLDLSLYKRLSSRQDWIWESFQTRWLHEGPWQLQYNSMIKDSSFCLKHRLNAGTPCTDTIRLPMARARHGSGPANAKDMFYICICISIS